MDNIKTYNEAKIAFKNSEGREPNMNNTEDMRIISAIQLGIQHILKMADKKYTEEDLRKAYEYGVDMEAGIESFDYKNYPDGFSQFIDSLNKQD